MQKECTGLPERPGISLYPAAKKWSYCIFSNSAEVIAWSWDHRGILIYSPVLTFLGDVWEGHWCFSWFLTSCKIVVIMLASFVPNLLWNLVTARAGYALGVFAVLDFMYAEWNKSYILGQESYAFEASVMAFLGSVKTCVVGDQFSSHIDIHPLQCSRVLPQTPACPSKRAWASHPSPIRSASPSPSCDTNLLSPRSFFLCHSLMK